MKQILKTIMYLVVAFLFVQFIVESILKLVSFLFEFVPTINIGLIVCTIVFCCFIVLFFADSYLENSENKYFNKLARFSRKLVFTFKTIVAPKIKETSKKSYQYIAKLMQRIDTDLNLTIQTLKDGQEKLKEYMKTLDQLRKQMNDKQQEVDTLKQQIDALKEQVPAEQLQQWQDELNTKVKELLESQQKYIQLEKTIKEKQRAVDKLLLEKQQLEEERKKLRAQYEQTQKSLLESEKRMAALQAEIDHLKEKECQLQQQMEQSVNEAEIAELQQTLEQLAQEIALKHKDEQNLQHEISKITAENEELKQALLQKVTEVAHISRDLTTTLEQMNLVETEKAHIEQQLSHKQQQLQHAQSQLAQLQTTIAQAKELEAALEKQLHQSFHDLHAIQTLFATQENGYIEEIEKHESQIEQLKNELTTQQNAFAIASAENAHPENLSENEQKLLEKEYEPRFNLLYKNCTFYEEFYNDFTQITSAERLRVEASIAQLSNHFDEAILKVRPHSVQTNTQNILEYPFQSDSAGRIYFNRKDNKIHFYRISRTKNGRGKLTQTNVIEWLKKYK